MEDLGRADLQHMRDDLRILWIVLVPDVVQRLLRSGERNRGDQLQVETGRPKSVHQGPVMVNSRLEPDGDGHLETTQQRDQALITVSCVQHCHAATARLVRHGDQHLKAVLGNVDAYENGACAVC